MRKVSTATSLMHPHGGFRSTLVRNTRGFTGGGLWAHLRPGSTKDNFASTKTGTELNWHHWCKLVDGIEYREGNQMTALSRKNCLLDVEEGHVPQCPKAGNANVTFALSHYTPGPPQRLRISAYHFCRCVLARATSRCGLVAQRLGAAVAVFVWRLGTSWASLDNRWLAALNTLLFDDFFVVHEPENDAQNPINSTDVRLALALL